MSIPSGLEVVEEWMEFLAQAGSGRFGLHPTPAADVVLQPVFEDLRHPHDVDGDAAASSIVHVLVAAKGLSRHETLQSGFFLGLADGGIARMLAVVDRALWHAPALALRGGHQSDLEACLSDAIGNHGSLLAARHLASRPCA